MTGVLTHSADVLGPSYQHYSTLQVQHLGRCGLLKKRVEHNPRERPMSWSNDYSTLQLQHLGRCGLLKKRVEHNLGKGQCLGPTIAIVLEPEG